MGEVLNKGIDEVRLTDLIEVDVLQRVQDVFSQMSQMAALVTDENGVAITKGSNFSRLCTEYCRKSPEGKKRCEQCDRMGALEALEQQTPVYYYCHANLIDFAAPIMLEGRIIGGFIGGQVLHNRINPNNMRKIAGEIGVDEEGFVAAAKEVPVVSMESITRSTKFIYGYTKILSEMAYTTYVARKMTAEALHAATAKSDFLANMSHEIRTPMNAIIGMAQIAKREEMSAAARACMDQIMSSGKMLLTLINDILDYSKMESGKLEIVSKEYEMLSLIQDVAAIITNRIGDKNIELILDVDPSIPQWLCGDEVRIKQVLINLANNAIKFTNSGYVALRLGYSWSASDEILLKCRIQDTGIGIKKEDFDKIFVSFEQVDSRRNRELEGTGLGLAIVKSLVTRMGGTISLESVCGEGSTFSVEFPQRVVNGRACILPLEDCPCVIGLVSNPNIRAELRKDVERIGALYVEAQTVYDVDSLLQQTQASFLFVSENLLSEELEQYVLAQKGLTTVRIHSAKSGSHDEIPGIKTIRKPLYSLNVAAVLRNQSLEIMTKNEDGRIDFTAPEAHILIVDDNSVNLTVALGLLEPLGMKIDTAESGKEAIEKVRDQRYDIIFMDHMMPEMDGVEAMHIIRGMKPEYANLPILAFTANAIRGTREMLLEEGMDDFVAKPVELAVLLAKVKKYLPPEKVQPLEDEKSKNMGTPSGQLAFGETEAVRRGIHSAASTEEAAFRLAEIAAVVPELNLDGALRMVGSAKILWEVIRDYYRQIDRKYEKIQGQKEDGNWKAYQIEVHALKSASRQIGATTLAKQAEQLEDAAARGDLPTIRANTEELLREYKELKKKLEPYFREEAHMEAKKRPDDRFKECVRELQTALERLDIGATERLVSEMEQYSYEGEEEERFRRLKEAVENIDEEAAKAVLAEWRKGGTV